MVLMGRMYNSLHFDDKECHSESCPSARDSLFCRVKLFSLVFCVCNDYTVMYMHLHTHTHTHTHTHM